MQTIKEELGVLEKYPEALLFLVRNTRSSMLDIESEKVLAQLSSKLKIRNVSIKKVLKILNGPNKRGNRYTRYLRITYGILMLKESGVLDKFYFCVIGSGNILIMSKSHLVFCGVITDSLESIKGLSMYIGKRVELVKDKYEANKTFHMEATVGRTYNWKCVTYTECIERYNKKEKRD